MHGVTPPIKWIMTKLDMFVSLVKLLYNVQFFSVKNSVVWCYEVLKLPLARAIPTRSQAFLGTQLCTAMHVGDLENYFLALEFCILCRPYCK